MGLMRRDRQPGRLGLAAADVERQRIVRPAGGIDGVGLGLDAGERTTLQTRESIASDH